jgi:hypothetical protein
MTPFGPAHLALIFCNVVIVICMIWANGWAL